MRIIFIVMFAGLLTFMPSASQAEPQTMCEVVISKNGETAQVPCCDLTLSSRDSRTNGSVAPYPGVDCDLAQKRVNVPAYDSLQRVLAKNVSRQIARFLRANPTSPIRGFTIEQPFYTFQALCCTCIPNETCSTHNPHSVCSFPDAGGMCPTGTLRTVCTFGDHPQEDVCTSVD